MRCRRRLCRLRGNIIGPECAYKKSALCFSVFSLKFIRFLFQKWWVTRRSRSKTFLGQENSTDTKNPYSTNSENPNPENSEAKNPKNPHSSNSKAQNPNPKNSEAQNPIPKNSKAQNPIPKNSEAKNSEAKNPNSKNPNSTNSEAKVSMGKEKVILIQFSRRVLRVCLFQVDGYTDCNVV